MGGPRREIGSDEREALSTALAQRLEMEGDVQLAYLHGSAVRDVAHVGDLDVAVLLAGTPTSEEALDRELELEASLAREVGPPVDLRVLNHAPLTFRFAVIQEGEVLVCRSRAAKDALETTTLSLYQDFRPYLEEYRRRSLGLGV